MMTTKPNPDICLLRKYTSRERTELCPFEIEFQSILSVQNESLNIAPFS